MVLTLLVLSEEISRKLSEKCVTQQVIYLSRMATILNLIDRKLKSDAIEQNITHQTSEQFSARVQNTLENYPMAEIDKIIDTMPKRMHQIINCNGGRLRY